MLVGGLAIFAVGVPWWVGVGLGMLTGAIIMIVTNGLPSRRGG
jgi:hypothetical protein